MASLSRNPGWITGPQTGSFEMPGPLREVLMADPVANPWAGFDAATAFARAGFRVLPIERGGKAPERRGPFQHGALSATSDLELVRDAWLAESTLNVGIAPDPSFVVLDVDPRHGGTLEAVGALGLPVAGYRERSGGGGWHVPLMMPPGMLATRSVTLAPGVEVKARGSYVVSPHSRLDDGDWYRPEPGRDAWIWPALSASSPLLPRLTEPGTAGTYDLTVTAENRHEAVLLIRRLQEHSTYRETVAQILNGRWDARYSSRSHADFAIAFFATHFVREHDRRREILIAVLERHSLKAASHPNPQRYLIITADSALEARDATDHEHVDDLAHIIDRSLASPPQTPNPPPVYDPTLWGRRGKRAGLMRDILAFAGTLDPDAYTQPEGWRRLPVIHMAALHDASDEAVRRAQVTLKDAGLIERAPRPKRHDGAPRMDARLRITGRGREALDGVRIATTGETES